jgi:hypothetical protein
MSYPGSTPEFRILKQNGEQTFQVRYINEAQGYISKWQNVPVFEETVNQLQNVESVLMADAEMYVASLP